MAGSRPTTGVTPRERVLDARVEVPGSKSIANRALVCAALASGTSTLFGVPAGDDTAAMVSGLASLGVRITLDGTCAAVHGTGGRLAPGDHLVAARLAGTTSRFLTAVGALAPGTVTVDGDPPLRARPMAPLHDALAALGAEVRPLERQGHLPVRVGRGGLRGGTVALPGDVSSQYVTALMLIAPLLERGLTIELTSPLVSRPYVAITAAVMAEFGARGIAVGEHAVRVEPGGYSAGELTVEPDASSASYPLAAAAICGGRVSVPGLGTESLQGDARFAGLLAMMGCSVTVDAGATTVSRDPAGTLRGIEAVDMADLSDLVPTLAVVAAFATSPTRITGVGFIRQKESDRLGDLVAELTALGADAEEEDDGMVIRPAELHGGRVGTHHDHRLAMALSLVGLVVPGVVVEDPAVVSKSWPQWWEVLARLARGGQSDQSDQAVRAGEADHG